MPRAKPIHPSLTAPRYSLGGHRNILDLIASCVTDDATLSTYMRVSWECYDVAGPKLYHHVECSEQRTLKAIVRGVVEAGAPMATGKTPHPINRRRQLLQHTRILSVSLDQCCEDPDAFRLFIQACNAPQLTVWADLGAPPVKEIRQGSLTELRCGKYFRPWEVTVGTVVLKNPSSSWTVVTSWMLLWEGSLPPADRVSLVLPTSTIDVDRNDVRKLATWSEAYTELSILLDAEHSKPPDRRLLEDDQGWIRQTCNSLMYFSTSQSPATINVYFMEDLTPPDGDGTSWSPSLRRSVMEVEYPKIASWFLGDGARPTFNFRTRKDYLDAGVTDEYTAEEVADLKRAEERSLVKAEASGTVV